jgi:hypothetical protein
MSAIFLPHEVVTMKFLSCALACICFAPVAFAADAGTTNKLPFSGAQLPASAKNAPEAPPWNAAPAQSPTAAANAMTAAPAVTTAANNDLGNSIPNYAPAANPAIQLNQGFATQSATPAQQSTVAQPNFTAPGNTRNAANTTAATSRTKSNATPSATLSAPISNPFPTADTLEPATRELKSVMIRRGSQAANSSVVQATNNSPQTATTPAGTQIPSANTIGAAPPARFVPDNPQPIPLPGNEAPPSSYGDFTPTANRVVPTANNVPSNWKSEAEPARYDQPLQLAPPPETSDSAAYVTDPPNSGLTATSSVPQLYAAPNAVPGLPSAVVQAAPITAAPATPAASGVTPAAAFEAPKTEEPPVDPEKMSATRAAADLLAGSELSSSDSIFGPNAVQLSLPAALANVGEQNRATTIRAYWRLNVALRDYAWASDELKRLEQVASHRNAYEGPMLSTARAAASARVEEAKSSVVRAQAVLEGLIGPSIMPQYVMDQQQKALTVQKRAAACMPVDTMLVGPYRTYFDVLFANRSAPGRARELDRLLPIRWETINDRTAAVQSATSAVHYAEQAHAKGEADMRDVLACHEELHKQRRAFLDAVLDYNIDVADYAVAVAAPGTPTDKLVSMLIRTKQPERVSSLPGQATFQGTPGNVATTSPGRPQFGAPSRSDGWVPSSLNSLETANRIGAIPRPNSTISSQPNPVGTPSDPFANPGNERSSAGNRYPAGDRYQGR